MKRICCVDNDLFRSYEVQFRTILFSVAIIMTIAFLQGCDRSSSKIDIKTEYQAVFLDNGQVFFGKIENAGSG